MNNPKTKRDKILLKIKEFRENYPWIIDYSIFDKIYSPVGDDIILENQKNDMFDDKLSVITKRIQLMNFINGVNVDPKVKKNIDYKMSNDMKKESLTNEKLNNYYHNLCKRRELLMMLGRLNESLGVDVSNDIKNGIYDEITMDYDMEEHKNKRINEELEILEEKNKEVLKKNQLINTINEYAKKYEIKLKKDPEMYDNNFLEKYKDNLLSYILNYKKDVLLKNIEEYAKKVEDITSNINTDPETIKQLVRNLLNNSNPYNYFKQLTTTTKKDIVNGILVAYDPRETKIRILDQLIDGILLDISGVVIMDKETLERYNTKKKQLYDIFHEMYEYAMKSRNIVKYSDRILERKKKIVEDVYNRNTLNMTINESKNNINEIENIITDLKQCNVIKFMNIKSEGAFNNINDVLNKKGYVYVIKITSGMEGSVYVVEKQNKRYAMKITSADTFEYDNSPEIKKKRKKLV